MTPFEPPAGRQVFSLAIAPRPDDIDVNDHVNNVVYLRWAQDIATAHWESRLDEGELAAWGWVALRHEIDYRRALTLDETAMARWGQLARLRDGVNAALEQARADKRIGKALEAHVTLVTGDSALDELRRYFEKDWADLFIVSDVEVSTDPALYDQAAETPLAGVRVLVSEARGLKCSRCWKHHPLVGANAEHPELCPRCAAVVAKLPALE